MGRGKLPIKRIEKASNRQVTFSKRRAGLLKKAHELSVLCEAEIAVIIFSSVGKLYEFASSSMNQVLTRFNKCLEASEVENEAEMANSGDVALLKEEIEQLKQKQMQLLGKDLNGMGLNELQELEELLTDGLFSVKERKEQLLMYQLEQSKMKEEQVMLENATLQKEIKELRSYFPVGVHAAPSSLECSQEKSILSGTHDASNPNTVAKSGTENVDIITELQLGAPSNARHKGKVPEQKTAEKESGVGTSGESY